MKNAKVGIAGISLLISGWLTAQNTEGILPDLNMPVIQTKYTADPAPIVHNDTVYLYTTHDEDDAEGFKMREWLLYTSTDMVNWQDRGAVASLKDFEWYKGDNGAWAPQVIERDGKFYMYCPIHGNGIGVLVADSPYGPFKDPIGKPLVWQKEHWDDIDYRIHRRRRASIYVLGKSEPLLCQTQQRHDFLYGQHRKDSED
nr:family 43 glycosylhydrolase [Bacteroides gallinarum]